jgi:excisionase family DNA binding protein
MDEAAKRLGVPPRMVRRLVESRKIGFVKVGRYVRFRQDHLEEYIAANERLTARGRPR